ncbi:MAG: YbaN family protein [Tenuifilaceae bacterium]|nr:YbaN family protein [Tenuifilaceae bacterium]
MTAGITSVGLGIIGIVVPILPTTPFLLLAAYLFVRSSSRLYRWLLTHKILGNYIRNYIQHKSIDRNIKIFTLILLWGTILLSVYLTGDTPWVQALLIAIAVGVSIHILTLNTTPKHKKN